ncbi:helix-hairpin-helix domain-containing protein [Rhizobium halophytocola]|uniref:NADH-quinone oxidoreductase subunit E n=1 Tax=Rhizobium halophytocola TaxID=735519 RepID=A0ABS4DY53_9HYPH|nr:helix-hairpin-helix domain-containing protein [Rhizobium halophytocola]MBP1850617.1 NADH-quinone oxidoreductase subunit E [Rhizobium halophytocola]
MAKAPDKKTEGQTASPDDLSRLADAMKDMSSNPLVTTPAAAMMAASAIGFGMATQMTGMFFSMMQAMADDGRKAGDAARDMAEEPVAKAASAPQPATAEAVAPVAEAPAAKTPAAKAPARKSAAPAKAKAKSVEKTVAKAPAKPAAKTIKPSPKAKKATRPETVAKPVAKAEKPAAAPRRKAKAGDLKQIDGIGPKVEERLKAMGVETIADIAGWSAADIARFDTELSLAGRIARDDWVGQAKTIVGGRG